MRLAKRRKVKPGDPMAVVSRFLDAANHHDADTLYATVHPEFESFQPLHPDRNFRGPGQLVSNWKAIFEAEPGFRLTVLRASTTGNTVWVELHGAGETAEAAGIFIVGVENGRIRWVRVYSDLVQGVAPEWDAEVAPATPADVGTEQPADAVGSEAAEASPEQEGDREAASADQDEAATVVAGSGGLRLVDNDDGTVSEPTSETETPADVGLRLVEPAGAEPGEPRPKPSVDEGPVETLVGPSRAVTAAPSSGEADSADPATDDLWLPPRSEDHPAGTADWASAESDSDSGAEAPATGADVSDAERTDIDIDLGTDADTDADTEVGTDPGTDAEAADLLGETDPAADEPPTDDEGEAEADHPREVQSFDSSLPREPRRSRWRKALRKY